MPMSYRASSFRELKLQGQLLLSLTIKKIFTNCFFDDFKEISQIYCTKSIYAKLQKIAVLTILMIACDLSAVTSQGKSHVPAANYNMLTVIHLHSKYNTNVHELWHCT